MVALAGLSLNRVYRDLLLVELVAGAALASALISAVTRRLAAGAAAPIQVVAMAAYAVWTVDVSARAGGLVGDLPTLITDAARNALPRLLTALIPIEPQPDTVLGPVILAWLAG